MGVLICFKRFLFKKICIFSQKYIIIYFTYFFQISQFYFNFIKVAFVFIIFFKYAGVILLNSSVNTSTIGYSFINKNKSLHKQWLIIFCIQGKRQFMFFTHFMSSITHAFNELKVVHFSLTSIVVKVYCIMLFLWLLLENT